MHAGDDGEQENPAETGFPWHYLVYAAPINIVITILTFALIGLYLGTDVEVIGIVGGAAYVLLILTGVLTLVLVEVGLFFDVPAVRAADVQWTPKRWMYMPTALLFSPLVGTVYVLQRRNYVGKE